MSFAGRRPLLPFARMIAPYGYFGVDVPVTAAISHFMLGQPYPRDIP
ncbi:MAG: hypothetical protein ABI190_03680 [Casimicrobiaceae bacterium]